MNYINKTSNLLILLLVLICIPHFSNGTKEVETELNSEKNTSDMLDLLVKLLTENMKSSVGIGMKFYILSPEEQKYLDFKRTSSELNINSDNYDTILPYILAKHAVQLKTKKNSEVNRGLYNVLNHMDMFNAGKRVFHA